MATIRKSHTKVFKLYVASASSMLATQSVPPEFRRAY